MSDMIERAVDRASTVMEAYVSSGSYEELIGDLLTDLMHYVDSLRVDREIDPHVTFGSLLNTASMHYDAEKNGD